MSSDARNPFQFNINVAKSSSSNAELRPPPTIQSPKASESLRCTTGGFSLSSSYWRTWLFMCFSTIIIFVILTPGLLLSLPTNNSTVCNSKVPLPGGALGICNNGIYVPASGDPITQNEGTPICAQRVACSHIFGSGYVNILTSIIHGVIFVIFVNIFSNYVVKGKS